MAVSTTAIPCLLDAPNPLRQGLAYTLRTLLRPLGLEPRFCELLPGDRPALYYGPDGDGRSSQTVVLHRAPDVVAFFEQQRARSTDVVHWLTWDGERWPLLFGDEAAPDLIASAFYWLSGWQEHVGSSRDEHDRFPVEASLQAQLGLLRRPPVDAYREMLAERLVAAGIDLRRRGWGAQMWALCPTFDVDYVRKWRPGILYREIVQYFLLNGRRSDRRERLRRFGASMRDALTPGDPYFAALSGLRDEVAARKGTGTIFFKAGAHDPHDVAYRLETSDLRKEARHFLGRGFEIGLHPSYHAHTNERYLAAERDRLAHWCGQQPVSVRQHYLRFLHGITPHLHERFGFHIDSTLGFAGEVGFRHGTCTPFRLFDLDAWREMDVWEVPLTFMEGALFVRLGLPPDEAIATTKELLDVCRRFGGVGVGLWHNVLWDEEDHPGWGEHFTATLDYAHRRRALIVSLRGALSAWLERPITAAKAIAADGS